VTVPALDVLREGIGPLHAASSRKKRDAHAALADLDALVQAVDAYMHGDGDLTTIRDLLERVRGESA
jgi:hypothetical protein